MRPERPSSRRQLGASLIEVLVALLIFSFGLLGLAGLYARGAPAPYENQNVIGVQVAADSLMAALATDMAGLPNCGVTKVSDPKSMPSWLQDWLTQAQAQIPSLAVTIVPGADASGNSCSSTSCGITATLYWTDGSSQRSQVFHAQIGIHS
jgi:type IV pilus assembly protein PilV